MANVSAEEWQLLSLFEVEPELLDAEVPWAYNDAVYRVQQGDLTLSFAIAPAYRDVRIVTEYQAQRLYELHAVNVQDVRYLKESRGEILEVILNQQEKLTLRIKPRIGISHAFNNVDDGA